MCSRWIASLLMILPFSPALAQDAPRAQLDAARLAWDRGDYEVALQGLESLLMDPASAALQDEIALLTGELYEVSEITEGGGASRWSPNGEWVAYESGTGSERVTHVLRLDGTALVEVYQVMGSGLVFAPDGGKVAFLVLLWVAVTLYFPDSRQWQELFN